MHKDIIENYFNVKKKIKILENTSSFDPPVTLLAVSKGHSVSKINAIFQQGHIDFAESYVQELQSKQNELSHLPINWHYIGRIQSNKCKYLAQNTYWVHSIDRFSVAEKLNNYFMSSRLSQLNVCIQLNFYDKDNQSGISSEDVHNLALYVDSLTNLNLRGVMCILDNNSDIVSLKLDMDAIYSMFIDIKHNITSSSFDVLSMGMSADMEPAILSGSNMVRVGSMIFGNRF